jgi:hypothetical protein
VNGRTNPPALNVELKEFTCGGKSNLTKAFKLIPEDESLRKSDLHSDSIEFQSFS